MARRALAALTPAAAAPTLPAWRMPGRPFARTLLATAATLAVMAAAVSLAPATAHAQGTGLGNVGPDLPDPEPPEGTASVLTVTVSQSVEASTNYRLDQDSEGTSYFGDTRLALDYLKQTETQTFGTGIDTGFRPLWEAGEDFDLVAASPSTAYLTFDQEGPNTAFDSRVRFRSRQVDDDIALFDPLDPLDPGLDPETLDEVTGNARQNRFDANVGFELGTQSPSSYAFRLRAISIDYTDVDEGVNVTPRDSASGEATWNLDVTPVLSTVVSAAYQVSKTENNVDTEVRTASVDAGLAYELSETLRVRGGLGYADREREQDVSPSDSNRTTESDTGPLVRGDVRYITANVTLLASAQYTTAAPQNRLTGNLSAIYRLPRGQLTGQVFQNYASGSGGDDQRVTGVGVGWDHDINTVSTFGLNAAWAEQVDVEGDDADLQRTTLTARYTQEITEAVTAQVGYSYRSRDRNGSTDASEVFLVIGRSFETGF